MKGIHYRGKRMFLFKVMVVCISIASVDAMEKSNVDSLAQALTRLMEEQTLLEGKLFLFGEGSLKPDYKRAYDLFLRALSHNYGASEACYWLGYMRYEGRGVEEDLGSSLNFFLTATDYIGRDAQMDPLLSASILYATGLLYKIKKNYKRALDFFSLILRFDESEMVLRARRQLARIKPPSEWWQDGSYYEMGTGGKKKDFNEAKKCYEIIAAVECPEQADAWNRLGIFHLGNWGRMMSDYSKAQKYFEKAANQEINLKARAFAFNKLGELFGDDEWIEQDYSKSRYYYEKAANQEIIKERVWAWIELGNYFRDGLGVQQDFGKAKEYYRKAITYGEEMDKGAAYTEFAAILCEKEVERVRKNYGDPVAYYEKMAQQEIDAYARGWAWWQLGGIFADEYRGREIDFRKAREYYKKAAECADPLIKYGVQEEFDRLRSEFASLDNGDRENGSGENV